MILLQAERSQGKMQIIILKLRAHKFFNLTSDSSWIKYEALKQQLSNVTETRAVVCTICVSGCEQVAEVDLRQDSGWLNSYSVCECLGESVWVCQDSFQMYKSWGTIGTMKRHTDSNDRKLCRQRRDMIQVGLTAGISCSQDVQACMGTVSAWSKPLWLQLSAHQALDKTAT